MCEFCGTDEERRSARGAAEVLAERLRQLAEHYDGLAHGRIKPHSDAMKKREPTAHAAIRALVEDWV